MKIKKLSFILPLMSFIISLSSCGNNLQNFEEYYDKNWTPGSNSLVATQPEIKNPHGQYNTLNEIRRSQNRVGLPSSGQANILVVPITFADDYTQLLFTEDDLTSIEKLYFNENNTYPSVSKYYEESSFGKLKLSGVVSPVVSLPLSYTDYILKAYYQSKDEAYNSIIEYVYNYLFVDTETYYIGDFDSDNDHRIDAISLICNYSYQLSFTDESLTTLHQSFVGPNNVYFSDSLADTDKVPVNSYSFISSYFYKYAYNKLDSRMYISLIGQMLGLDSYEDLTGNTSSGTLRAPISYFDPMSGSIGDHNAFSKYQLGWIKPQLINASKIGKKGLEITISSFSSSGDCLLLYTGKSHNQFGEYLLIDLYSPTDNINALDSNTASLYSGLSLFKNAGLRVYQIDARLVRGVSSTFNEYDGNPDFKDMKTLENGEKESYVYDYAYTNSSVNEYEQIGLINYPLISLLSKNGVNRHNTDYTNILTIDDLFLEGDTFGTSDQIEGFYQNFSFHGNGNHEQTLGITFEVKELKDNQATIIFKGVK